MNEKKERKHIVRIDLPYAVKDAKLTIYNETGEIHIFDKDENRVHPTNIILEHYYEGNQKHVPLSRLVAGLKFPLKGLSSYDFLATYDWAYVVDTNRLETPDGKIHDITSFLRARVTCFPCSCKIELYERVGYLHFTNLAKSIHPEKAGWQALIQQDFFQEDLENGLTMAIITDHDINNLEKYNKRKAPVSDTFFIPKGVTLMFATADKSDTPVNKLIKTTDRLANLYKGRFLEKEIVVTPQECQDIECESFCFVNEKRSGLSIQPNIMKRPNMVYTENSRMGCLFVEGAFQNE